MRNYSEIGCLTLLGVTLTVYVAVGHSDEGNLMPDRSAENVFSQPLDTDWEGDTYCLSVTLGRCHEQSLALVLPSVSANYLTGTFAKINISDKLYIPVIKDFSHSKVPVALPVNSFKSNNNQPSCNSFGWIDSDILPPGTFELCPEIRAGPFCIFS